MFAPRGWFQRRGNQAMYRAISQSGLFDKNWYRNSQITGAEKLFDPLWHFISRGWTRGLDPSPQFSTSFYLGWSKDVRTSGVNPLDHFITYGKDEGRPPLQPLSDWRPKSIAAMEPIKFYRAAGERRRLSVVIDQHSPNRWSGDRALLVAYGAWIAASSNRSLRVLVREGEPAIPHLPRDAFAWPDGLARPEITTIPAGREYSDIAQYADEVFLGTSWSSAHSLHAALGGKRLGYLVLDDEASRLPQGTAHSLASSALRLKDVTFLSGSASAANGLGSGQSAESQHVSLEGVTLESFMVSPPGDAHQRIVVWTSNDANYSHLREALEALEKAVVGGDVSPALTPIHLVGSDAPQVLLAGTHALIQPNVGELIAEVGYARQSLLTIALTNSGTAHPVAEIAQRAGRGVVSSHSGNPDGANLAQDIKSALAPSPTKIPQWRAPSESDLRATFAQAGKRFL